MARAGRVCGAAGTGRCGGREACGGQWADAKLPGARQACPREWGWPGASDGLPQQPGIRVGRRGLESVLSRSAQGPALVLVCET